MQAGGQRTTHTADNPPAVVHGEPTEGAGGDANPPHPATAENRAHHGATMSPAPEGMRSGPPPVAPETDDILVLIFNETAPTAGQAPPMDEHLQDDESFAALMVPAGTGPPPQDRQSHLHGGTRRDTGSLLALKGTLPPRPTRRNYATLGLVAAVHTTPTGDDHARGRPVEVTRQHLHPDDVPTHGVQTPAAADTISGPTEQMPPQVAQPWAQERLDCAESEGDVQRPSAEADRAAALDLDLWLPQTCDVEQLTLKVRTRWILMDTHHIMNGTSTMGDVIFDHLEGRHFPPLTMGHPCQWWYVATRLMAHIRAYTTGNLDSLHWWWHHRAALRIREALLRHIIWAIRTPHPRGPSYLGSATGQRRRRSLTTQWPPRQMARTSNLQSPHRPPPDVALPCSPQRSPVRPFTHPRPDHSDQRTRETETRQHSPRTPIPPRGSSRSAGTRSQSCTPPSAALRLTFRDDADNSQDGSGGRLRRQMSGTAEPQGRLKRPWTDRTQIPTLLPATERACLAALSVQLFCRPLP